MENNLEPWLFSTLDIRSSTFRDLRLKSEVQHVSGRKLDSFYQLKPHPSPCNKPFIVQGCSQGRSAVTCLNLKSQSKSPLRSHSQKSLNKLKESTSETPHYVSRLRSHKKYKTAKPERLCTDSAPKSAVLEACNKLSSGTENIKKHLIEKGKKDTASHKVKSGSSKVKEKSLKKIKACVKKQHKHYVSEVRGFDGQARINENEEMRLKSKAEGRRRESKKAVMVLNHSQKPKLKILKEEKKPKKSPDPVIQKYIKNKNRIKKLNDLHRDLDEASKEKERVFALSKLEKVLKRKPKTIKHKVKTQQVEDKPYNLAHSFRSLSRTEIKRIQKPRPLSEFSIKSFKGLKKRVRSSCIRNEAAILIQRWFRSILVQKLKSIKEETYTLRINTEPVEINLITECEDLQDSLSKSTKFNELRNPYEWQTNKLKKKIYNQSQQDPLPINSLTHNISSAQIFLTSSKAHLDSNEEPKFSTSISSFHSRRPKELQIVGLSIPMIQNTFENSDSLEGTKLNDSLANESRLFLLINSSSQRVASENIRSIDTYRILEDLPKEEPNDSTSLVKCLQVNTSENSICNNISLCTYKSPVAAKDSLDSEVCEISLEIGEDAETGLLEALQPIEVSEQSISKEKSKLPEFSISEENLNSFVNSVPMHSPNISCNANELISEILDDEISSYLSTINFKLKEKEVNPNADFIELYLSVLYEELKPIEEEILEIFNTPAYVDPLQKLSLLQNTRIGELSKSSNLELILPAKYCARLKQKLGRGLASQKIYTQMMFDCVNEAMNKVRPLGTEGVPDPWSLKPLMLFGEPDLKAAISSVNKLLQKWREIKGGAFSCELEDEDKLQSLREDRMSCLLCYDVNFEEKQWVDYEDEEAQTLIDVGDAILEEMLVETALWCRLGLN